MEARDRRDHFSPDETTPEFSAAASPRQHTLNSLRWISAAMDAARRYLALRDASALDGQGGR